MTGSNITWVGELAVKVAKNEYYFLKLGESAKPDVDTIILIAAIETVKAFFPQIEFVYLKFAMSSLRKKIGLFECRYVRYKSYFRVDFDLYDDVEDIMTKFEERAQNEMVSTEAQKPRT